uniref:Gliding motility lipoprotein GldH n=2 Tax=unclassified Prevotella TaxID=2638335 RepID=A0AB33JHQ9_9BACT
MRRLLATIAVAATLLSACTGNKVYDRYEHTPIAGWEKNDTLKYQVPPMARPGLYQAELGLRINGSYPFMGLTLIVDQTRYPDGSVKSDTLNCELIDHRGNSKGRGLSYYQYNFKVAKMYLHAGDSLSVSVRHDMKREILPGISDVGIMLYR